ncbi:hypothetical protein [Sphingobacterium puteale]|nr:hypothetical protein [Sphingobacterium puteale]
MKNFDLNCTNLEPLNVKELTEIEGGGKIGVIMRTVGEILVSLSVYF